MLAESDVKGEGIMAPVEGHMLLRCPSPPTERSPGHKFSRIVLYAVLVCFLLSGPYLLLFASTADPWPLERIEQPELTASPMGLTPPVFFSEPYDPTLGDSGVPIVFTAAVFDADGDMLNITWEWGDGTITTNTTDPANPFIVITESHIYNPVPEPGMGGGGYNIQYTMNLTLDDGESSPVTAPTLVRVFLPPNGSPGVVNLSVAAAEVDPIEVVTVIAAASDPEGEPLTWTFQFNDSIQVYRVAVFYTPASAPGEVVWNNITHVFGTEGLQRITLNISDALPPNQVWPHNVSLDITVDVKANRIPTASSIIGVDPPSPIIESGEAYLLVNYSIQAYDLDGDVISVTWDFGDGSPQATNVTTGGTGLYTFIQQRNYTDTGVFNISAVVTDGRLGHDVPLYVVVYVNSTNRPPQLDSYRYNVSSGAYALPNEILNFTLSISDPERDTIQVIVDFGDNSTILFLNLTVFGEGNISTVEFSHSYLKVGNYTINITYTDNKQGLFQHTKYVENKIWVHIPPVIPENNWNWWDSTSLGLLCGLIVLGIARLLYVERRRKRIEAQGMTYEEWKLLSTEMPEEIDVRKEGGS